MAITDITGAKAQARLFGTAVQLASALAQSSSGLIPGSGECEVNKTLAYGTDPDEIDAIWASEGTLGAAGTVDIDLAALTGEFGQTISLTKVKGVLIKNVSTDAAGAVEIQIGGAAAHEWSAPFAAAGDKASLPDGSCVWFVLNTKAGWTVDGANKDLRITNADGVNSAKYEIVVVGLD